MSEHEKFDQDLKQYLKSGAEIPNAPFLFKAARQAIDTELAAMGFRPYDPKVGYEGHLAISGDDSARFARIKYGEPSRRILITTHLDHPYVVLNGKDGGVPLGTVGIERLRRLADGGGIPIKVYTESGEFLGMDIVKSVGGTTIRPTVKTEGIIRHPANSQGLWALNPITYESGKVAMINSDNATSTAVALSLIKSLVQRPISRGANVEFAFNYLEEIKQVSATGTGLKRSTPFGKIEKDDVIIVLESASAETPKEFEPVLKKLNLNKANYEDGVIIRVNDRHLVHGQKVEGINEAESLLLNSAEQIGANFQQTIVGGTCDATAYSLFLDTPNIASLTIPTKFKHNDGPNGQIVQEEVLARDVAEARDILERAVELAGDQIDSNPKSFAHDLKGTEVAADEKQLRAIKSDRITTYRSNIQRVRAGRFYPESLNESVKFFLGRVEGRVKKGL